MVTQKDRDILKDVGRKYLLDIAFDSQILKNKLTFKEHINLCKFITELSYEDVIGLTITEDITEFEGRFRKFLKYSFAAVAGLTIGLGPSLGMFALYMYRKMTDTCSKACINRFPMSDERKVCRYECQVNAVRKVAMELKTEISKCSRFPKPEKCEKKLTKAYIKWAKRLETQTIKLSQAKLGVERDRRKRRQKELMKRAKGIGITAGYQVPKSKLLKIIAEDERIRQSIPFRQHIQIYQAVSLIEQKPIGRIVKPPKTDPKREKRIRQATFVATTPLMIPGLGAVLNTLLKKFNFACIGKCAAQKKFPKGLCLAQCNHLSAKHASQVLTKQLPLCDKNKNPFKCKKKIYKLLKDWKQREVERKIKFDTILRQAQKKGKV